MPIKSFFIRYLLFFFKERIRFGIGKCESLTGDFEKLDRGHRGSVLTYVPQQISDSGTTGLGYWGKGRFGISENRNVNIKGRIGKLKDNVKNNFGKNWRQFQDFKML